MADLNNEKRNSKNFFESYIRPKLIYVGSIGAVLMSVAYIAVVLVLIFGFKVKSIEQSAVFAIVNAIVGFIIMQFLKVQGIDFAKNLPENIEIIKEYYNTKTKDKKTHSLKYFWLSSLSKDFFSKLLLVVITTTGLIYIVIEGTQDYVLLLLALVNLILFICFGLLSLVNAYDFYNNSHVPYMIEKIEELNLEKKEFENVRNQEEQSNNRIEKPSGTSTEE